MLLGAGVAVLSVAVAALDLRLNLPDWMIRIAMIKLAFVAAGGLLAAGALMGRHAKSRSLTAAVPGLLPDERPRSFGRQMPDEAERRVMPGQEPEARRRTDDLEPG